MRLLTPAGVVGGVRVTGFVLLALSAALVTGACGSDTAPPDARAGDPTLAAIRSDIFNGTCALSSCHAAPTVAAKLDLHSDGLCQRLVRQTSCLFPDKVLVLPGKPEVSFLMDKLRGTGLEGTPDPSCATSNVLMPLGLPALSGGQLAQIEEWIRAGASCGGDVPPDAGIIDAGGAGDAGIDGPDESLADIASISAAATMITVGERTQGTVTFTHGVPPSGQVIVFEVDEVNQSVVSVDAFKSLEPGVSSVTFDVLGQMVGSAIITASSGTNSMSITITVTGVTLSDDKDSTTQIAGALPIPDRRVAGSSDKKRQ
jgi:hypothetical protein